MKICQSCGRPMRRVRDYGLNTNKTRNKKYCCFCFFHGKFREPKITLEQMVNKVGVMMAKEMKMTEGEARIMAERFMPKLSRWKDKGLAAKQGFLPDG
ncbi:MAG: zinc ribbon domain-containing protein [Patescibacteria group bacterium]